MQEIMDTARKTGAGPGRYAILRSSWVFSAHGANFVKTMLRLSEQRDHIRVVADQGGGSSVAVRPEHMILSADEMPQGNSIPAKITDIVYLGAETRLALKTPGGSDLTMSLPTHAVPATAAIGAPFWVNWAPEHGVFL